MTRSVDPAFPGDVEVERRLDAYAEIRLDPSVAVTTVARTRVMVAAHRHAALLEAARRPGRTPSAVGWTRTWLRPLGAMSVALLTLGILAGTAIASKPGGPFYGVLLFTERLALPSDLAARVPAETRRLDARLQEAEAAASAGDGAAARAALSAYSSVVIEVAEAVGGDASAERRVQEYVDAQAPELARVLRAVPSADRPEIERAIAGSTGYLHRNDTRRADGPITDGSGEPFAGGPGDRDGAAIGGAGGLSGRDGGDDGDDGSSGADGGGRGSGGQVGD